jgi:hypothetical protein
MAESLAWGSSTAPPGSSLCTRPADKRYASTQYWRRITMFVRTGEAEVLVAMGECPMY